MAQENIFRYGGAMTQKLEETVAHLTRVVDDLSDVVARQDVELQRLTKLLAMLVDREKDREQGDGGVILGDERPPHY